MAEHARCIKCKTNLSQHGSGLCVPCRTIKCGRCGESVALQLRQRTGFCKHCAQVKYREEKNHASLAKVWSFDDHTIAV